MLTIGDVKKYWDSIVPENRSDHWWQAVCTHYQEKQRHYHTLDHILDMFGHWEHFKASLKQPDMVALAILFHDIIYEPKASDNEEKSAELFLEFSQDCGIPKDPHDVDKVKNWILETKSHKTEVHRTPGLCGAEDLHFFLDFDMAVLGRESTSYKEYAAQIREEYIHIPEEVYNVKRPEVLTSFLKTPNIFATREFREKYELLARRNIQEEIETLKSLGS